MVLDEHGKAISEQKNQLEKIKKTLRDHLLQQGQFKPNTHRRTPRLLKQFSLKTQVSISHDEGNNQTILEVVAPDRPGLLSIIANIFVELNITLNSAKITTLGERVEDIFFIADRENQAIIDPAACAILQQRICEELDLHIRQATP